MNLLSYISFLKRAKNRLLVFENLNKPSLPSELVRQIFKSKSNTYFNLVSRALHELKDKKLIEILNPKEKTGRIYKRTELGEKVLKKL